MRVWASTSPLYFVKGFVVCVFAVCCLIPNKSLSLPSCPCLLCLRLPLPAIRNIFLPFNLAGREKKPHQDGNTIRASPRGGGFLVHSS